MLVITDDDATARWAKGPFGTSQLQLRPVVWNLKEMPPQLSSDDAPYKPLLEVIRAIYQPSEQAARRVFDIVKLLPEEIRVLALEAVMQVLPSGLRQALEDQMEIEMDPSWFMSKFARRHFARGKEEGLSEGKEVGRIETLRALVMDLLRIKLSPAQAASAQLPEQIREPSKLTQLILELTSTSDEAQALAAVERALTC